MFVFENLFDFEDCVIQMVFKEVELEILIVVLKGVLFVLCQKFFVNMLQCVVELFVEDFDVCGLVCVFEVEMQQCCILQIVCNFVESGQIVIGGKVEDVYV